jgi:fused signal recognition particle receptor
MIFKIFQKKESEKKTEIKIQENLIKKTWFQKLKEKLGLSSLIFQKIFNIFSSSDSINYDEFETLLLETDMDYDLISKLIEKIKNLSKTQSISQSDVKNLMKNFMIEILERNHKVFDLNKFKNEKKVVMFCGINGSGKTTSIAKISSLYKDQFKTLMICCDSFRAAASAQLSFWANLLSIDFFDGGINSSENQKTLNPSTIAYKGLDLNENHELFLIDTSGRLTTNQNLMKELEAIDRVLKKKNLNYPQESILVLDGTMGQNLHNQIEAFSKVTKLTGLIITKLDGIAKGGIIISLAYKHNLPIYFIGIGEKQDDINFFNPEEFVNGLLEN